ncbi:MAG TPA: Lrp/AsnC family transcriptional regulator [Candidatus Poseidoniales archaeon]|nr:MAG TPA: Lrp/AsnC family transcriptional regulator [Candidatus Poseidoniales archaeon]
MPLSLSMATGYVLVNVEPGMEFSVFESVKGLDEVADATLLFGDYDLIIKVISEDMSSIAAFVVEKVRQVEGVSNTKTLAGAEI